MKCSRLKENLAYLFYNFALTGVFVIGSPFFLFKVISGKYRAGLKQRFGLLPKSFLDKKAGRLWIHAVSVGEVGAAIPIGGEIKKRAPDIEIFFSTTTSTGQEVARKKWGKNVFYYPLDFPGTVKRTLNYVQPDVFIAMETEIWPNLFRRAHRQGVPVLLLNARISNRSFRGYRRIKFLLKAVFSKVSMFGAQTAEDGDRLRKLGVENQKVIVTGNTKFDSAGTDSSKERLDYFESMLGLREKDVIVFGSTHPGEEEIILEACKAISKDFSGIRFILCPRHPERGDKVEELVKTTFFKTIRRSELKGDRKIKDEDFIIVDTVGELSTIYGLADIVFVGGSLIPKGGQNIIEPAFWGKPILFGPHVYNFREIVRAFLEKDAACQVRDGEELKEKLIFFLTHKEKAVEMGNRAKGLILASRGASQKNAELILKYIQ
jgi:3-deoxy-D-manno-octulosonic-acid transferase